VKSRSDTVGPDDAKPWKGLSRSPCRPPPRRCRVGERLDYARLCRTAKPTAPMLVAMRTTSRPRSGASLAVPIASAVLPSDPPGGELGSVAPAFEAPILGAPYAGEVAIVLSTPAVARVTRRSALRAAGESGCAAGFVTPGVDCPLAVGTSSTYC
jgi:hypothetical protein